MAGQYVEKLYDIYGWKAPRYNTGHAIFAPAFGADEAPCSLCDTAHNSELGACATQIPGSPERESCNKASDDKWKSCLTSSACPGASSAVGITDKPGMGLGVLLALVAGAWFSLK
jgi:hypothetical protein